MRELKIILVFLFLSLSPPAFAAGICDYYKEFMPGLYEITCKGSASSSRPSGASSTFAQSFNMTPASLPTEPSGYGVEVIGTLLRQPSREFAPTFSLVKGFQKFGAGLSTASNNTFQGNDVVQRSTGGRLVTTLKPYEPAQSSLPNFNLGTAVNLWKSKASWRPKLDLGLSARFNATTNTLGGGPALMFSVPWLSVGVGVSREKVATQLSRITFLSGIATARILFLEFEYNYLRNYGGFALDPIHIFTTTTQFGPAMVTLSRRFLFFQQDGRVGQWHGAIQWRLTKKVTVGALYNYIPGATSLATQIYF